MIDTPNNCHVQAAFCRAQAANTSLSNVQLRHLAAAEAWEGLAKILEAGPRRLAMSRVEATVPEAEIQNAIIEAKRARRGQATRAQLADRRPRSYGPT